MIKNFLKWYHKRRAHAHDLTILSYPMRDDQWVTNRHYREYHEKCRDYHVKEIEKLKK